MTIPKRLIAIIQYGCQMAKNINHELPNVVKINSTLYTRNLDIGKQVYGETLHTISKVEYRFWDPKRSKLAALILNGCKYIPIYQNSKILYLGAANGTTASHISDIIVDGKLYCIEFSSRAFRDLLAVASNRKNMFPILEDAFFPSRYKTLVEQVDLIYQDVSQRDQIQLFLNNANLFLKPHGYGILMIKSRSIDITQSPAVIFEQATKQIKTSGFKVLEQLNLEPYTKDHLGLILKSK